MKKKTLSATPLKVLLERVYLSGIITECLLEVTKGRGHVLAIDNTSSVLVDVSQELPGLDDGKYGIGKLDTLVKFLGMCQDEELNYTIDDKWLTLRRPGHGKFSVLLLENDMVGTQPEADPELEKFKNKYAHKLPLTQEFMDDSLGYIGLVASQMVSFQVGESGRVLLENTTTEIERFEAVLGKLDDVKKAFTISVYGTQLSAVFNALKPGEKTTVYLNDDLPVIIEQDDDNVWAITNAPV